MNSASEALFRILLPKYSENARYKAYIEEEGRTEVLALKHEGRILGQWSNPKSGSRKRQAWGPIQLEKNHHENHHESPI